MKSVPPALAAVPSAMSKRRAGQRHRPPPDLIESGHRRHRCRHSGNRRRLPGRSPAPADTESAPPMASMTLLPEKNVSSATRVLAMFEPVMRALPETTRFSMLE